VEYITKHQLDNSLKHKTFIELEDLVELIEQQFGYQVSLAKKDHNNLTEEQKKKLAKIVFSDEDVLRQLQESESEPENNDIESHEDFARFMNEARNAR
jgi:hypothetical protein